MSTDPYLKSIYAYPEQFIQAWGDCIKKKFPQEYQTEVNDVVIAGMGGSSFGARVVKSVFGPTQLLVPTEIVDNYDLPAFADEKTLVIAMSYSGNTEETLGVAKEALDRGCKLVIVTTDGKLSEFAERHDIPAYILKPKHNPSNAPRTALGYIIGATLAILSNLNLLDFSDAEARKVYKHIKAYSEILQEDDRMPLQVSKKILERMPIFISAEHLTAGTHIWRNFLNETAKYTGFTDEIPEMNHHFLDGLSYPREVREKAIFIFATSALYNPRNKKRIEITRKILKKNDILDIAISLGSFSRLGDFFELVMIGSLVSFNMARVHNENPSSNDMVDYLKKELG